MQITCEVSRCRVVQDRPFLHDALAHDPRRRHVLVDELSDRLPRQFDHNVVAVRVRDDLLTDEKGCVIRGRRDMRVRQALQYRSKRARESVSAIELVLPVRFANARTLPRQAHGSVMHGAKQRKRRTRRSILG